MTLEEAFSLAESPAPVGSERFRTFMRFVIPSEVEFVKGHQDDYAYVRTENVPGDNGGKTKYGIDQASHPRVDIDSLTLRDALQLYYDADWVPLKAEGDPPGYAEFLCDVHLNGGNGPRMLQQALNTLPGISIHVDGWIGDMTLYAMQQAGDAGVKACIQRRDEYYRYLAYNNSGDRQFLAGWLNRDQALDGWITRNAALSAHLSLT